MWERSPIRLSSEVGLLHTSKLAIHFCQLLLYRPYHLCFFVDSSQVFEFSYLDLVTKHKTTDIRTRQTSSFHPIKMTCNGLRDAIIMERSILWYGSSFIHEPDSRAIGDIWHHMTRWERRVAARRAELEAFRKQQDGLQPLDFEQTRAPLITRIEKANSTCELRRHNLNIRTV
ncbi:hypothetical protein EYR41_002554 [Orbilia oligospora]|uniref:Uncharacterized protein n=1 Tax=Orbilia oligospora TaxID=2813651 RepID=A0A7C8TYG1_ORBOL|nr:hypothetical protein TWF751_011610 [Orbilia oligospora]TGJ70520.1 hypothetical protein EYR41_002554 [Orbilia oligospora]